MGLLDWLFGRPAAHETIDVREDDGPGVRPDEDPVAFHHRYWADTDGDSEEDVVRCEERLGFALPQTLRRFYRSCGLRESEQLHLWTLERLKVEDGVLVFAREQQGCFSWGIAVRDAAQADPQLVADPLGKWKPDGGAVSDWLRLFTLINRPYAPPCDELAASTEGWDVFAIRLESVGRCRFYVSGTAVADDVCVGARTRAQLLLVQDEAPDESPEPEYRYRQSIEERTARVTENMFGKLLPSPALASIIGAEPVTRLDATKGLMAYLAKHSLRVGPTITVDAKLRALTGSEGTVTIFDLLRIVNENLGAPTSTPED